MQNSQTEYTIIKSSASNGELEKYLECFERNGTKRSMENLQWLHHQNLVHDNAIYYAMKGDALAGIYTALPVIFKVNDSLLPGLQSIDTLTDIDHRGKGLFIKLANRLYDEEAANKFALVYGIPNENSAPGFFTKLKWTSFGEAPFLLKPFNIFFFVKKIFKRKKQTDFSWSNYIFDAPKTYHVNMNTVIKSIDLFDDAYDKMWKVAGKDIKVCVDRSAAYMNWRYVTKPAEFYYRYGLYINDQLSGAIVFTIKHKHDGLVGYIMELIFDPANKKAGDQLMRFSSRLCRQHKVDAMLAWSLPGCFNRATYKKAGYYVLPEKFRGQQLYFGVRAFDPSIAPVVNDINNWYMSYSDSDTA
ncbi:MAG: GNAT family N-acetyltransferase [Ferruginibacter sp.]